MGTSVCPFVCHFSVFQAVVGQTCFSLPSQSTLHKEDLPRLATNIWMTCKSPHDLWHKNVVLSGEAAQAKCFN